jgi:exonuclease VII large subunit
MATEEQAQQAQAQDPQVLVLFRYDVTGNDHDGYCSGTEGYDIGTEEFFTLKLIDVSRLDAEGFLKPEFYEKYNRYDTGCRNEDGSGYCNDCFQQYTVVWARKISDEYKNLMNQSRVNYQKYTDKIKDLRNEYETRKKDLQDMYQQQLEELEYELITKEEKLQEPSTKEYDIYKREFITESDDFLVKKDQQFQKGLNEWSGAFQ